jgi:hypothetical protein
MNRPQYDESQRAELDQAIAGLVEQFPALTGREVRLRTILSKLQQRSASNSRAFELLNIRTAEDLAPEWGVSVRRAQAIIAHRHERFGVGRKFGRTWALSAQEWKSVEIDAKYRQRQ